jgi:hypothetical protein
VQLALGGAGLLYRVQLRAQVVRAQEVVGDPQAARGVALEKMEAAVTPEVRQG